MMNLFIEQGCALRNSVQSTLIIILTLFKIFITKKLLSKRKISFYLELIRYELNTNKY